MEASSNQTGTELSEHQPLHHRHRPRGAMVTSLPGPLGAMVTSLPGPLGAMVTSLSGPLRP